MNKYLPEEAGAYPYDELPACCRITADILHENGYLNDGDDFECMACGEEYEYRQEFSVVDSEGKRQRS